MHPLAFLPALLLGDVHAALQLSARTEVQARSAYSTDVSEGSAVADLDVTPGIAFAASGDARSVAVSYSPRLLLREPYAGGPVEFLHRAQAAAELRLGGSDRLWVSQYFTYGLADFTTLTTGADPAAINIEPVYVEGTVRNVQSDSRLGLDLRLSPRSFFTVYAGWGVSGGVDAASQVAVPLQRGPSAGARLSFTVTRVDSLATNLFGADARFSSGRRATVVVLQEEYRHRFGRLLEGELDLGVSAVRSQLSPDAETTTDILPVGGVTLSGRVPEHGQRWEGRLNARATPFVDRFAGAVYERAELSAEVTCLVREKLRLRARGGAALTVSEGPQRGERAGLFEGSATWEISRFVQVEGSFQGNWVQQPTISTLTLFQWVAGVSVTFRERVIL